MPTPNFRHMTLLLAVIGATVVPQTALAQQQLFLTSPATCGYGYLYTVGTPIPDAYYTSESFACPGPGGGDVRSAYATGRNSTAIGARANAIGDGSMALGHAARSSAASSVAIGSAAAVEATATNSVALGSGSIATQPNTVSVGTPGSERRISNVAAGTLATDAVNVSQLETALATFNLGRTDQRDTRRGIAAAVAMGSASMPSAPGRTSYVMNVSTFRGEQAVGGSIMYRLPTATTLAVTGGFSFGGNKNNAAKVGVAGEF